MSLNQYPQFYRIQGCHTQFNFRSAILRYSQFLFHGLESTLKWSWWRSEGVYSSGASFLCVGVFSPDDSSAAELQCSLRRWGFCAVVINGTGKPCGAFIIMADEHGTGSLREIRRQIRIDPSFPFFNIYIYFSLLLLFTYSFSKYTHSTGQVRAVWPHSVWFMVCLMSDICV